MSGGLPANTASRATTALQALELTPWLAHTPAAVLEKLAQHAVLHRAPAGLQLFEQAEVPAFALLLIEGAIELLAVRGGEERLVEIVRAVDLLLPAAILNRRPYLVRARVHEDAMLLLIQADAFRKAVASNHALALAVLACQAAQFRRQLKLAKTIGLRSAEERIGCFLVKLAEAHPGVHAIRLPADKRAIANQLGMSRETFSRALPGMARHGLNVSGDALVVEDLEAARAQFPLDPLIDGDEPIVPLALNRT
jgi:CRP/FNR family transcriptional activator FtrB